MTDEAGINIGDLPDVVNLIAYRGDTTTYEFEVYDYDEENEEETPADLSACEFKAQARKSRRQDSDLLFNFDVAVNDNIIQVTIPDAASADLVKSYWDLEDTVAKFTYFRGQILPEPDVTRDYD